MNLSHFQVHHPKRRRKRKRKSTGHKSTSSVLHSQSRKREKPLTRKNLSTLLKASSSLPFTPAWTSYILRDVPVKGWRKIVSTMGRD
ncbi:hypothetical protein TNIN_227201 [Trichonephila inaurata madagascariensis]|uniref:Uncharacterized protein n=1 Tax=Trichonephila inaurata madagascariensis TaxID=2747483 RepID=A0A8X6X9G0_9ARAC|nr:hypothetical protein TNIN_227201 [Trichonephila inaurata madagascariensis]